MEDAALLAAGLLTFYVILCLFNVIYFFPLLFFKLLLITNLFLYQLTSPLIWSTDVSFEMITPVQCVADINGPYRGKPIIKEYLATFPENLWRLKCSPKLTFNNYSFPPSQNTNSETFGVKILWYTVFCKVINMNRSNRVNK